MEAPSKLLKQLKDIHLPTLRDYLENIREMGLTGEDRKKVFNLTETIFQDFLRVVTEREKILNGNLYEKYEKNKKLTENFNELLRLHINSTRPSDDQELSQNLKEEVERLRHQYTLDEVTNILKASAFKEKVEGIMVHERRNRLCAVLFVDIRGFKKVNYKLGHQMGTSIISEVAQILSRNLRSKEDILARCGGDEFEIFIDSLRGIYDLEEKCQKLSLKVKNYDWNSLGVNIPINIDIGAVFFELSWYDSRPKFARELVYKLIDNADKLMKQAKAFNKCKQTRETIDGKRLDMPIIKQFRLEEDNVIEVSPSKTNKSMSAYP